MDDYDYEQVLQYENEIYQVNEETSESENEELTNALAQIYYAVDNSKSNISNNQDVMPKHEVTKSNEADEPNKITGNNDVPLENGNNRSQKDLREPVHLESDYDQTIPHKRKKIMYDEDNYGGRKRCALCKGYDHDDRTCENILYPENDEATWRQYNVRETAERTRNFNVYCYNCAGNHLGKNCSYKFPFTETSSLSSRIGISRREYARGSAKKFS